MAGLESNLQEHAGTTATTPQQCAAWPQQRRFVPAWSGSLYIMRAAALIMRDFPYGSKPQCSAADDRLRFSQLWRSWYKICPYIILCWAYVVVTLAAIWPSVYASAEKASDGRWPKLHR